MENKYNQKLFRFYLILMNVNINKKVCDFLFQIGYYINKHTVGRH